MSDVKKPGYRDTLNLPVTAFPMKADLATREPQRLASWAERGLYARLRERRAGQRPWLLHDGPPYSNAHIHMGTAANKIWKDAAVRQASLRGFDAPFVPGWDNHGMPIETQVSRAFADQHHKPSPVELRRACRAHAREWIGVQRGEFERLGVWGDWARPYLTMDGGFEAETIETLAALHARGFVQRGKRSIHWCPTDRTALALAEIEYADVPSPSIHVRFPLRRDATGALAAWPDANAVAWTTTPWTLPANQGLMVDPAADYAVVRAAGQVLIVAAARLAAFAERLGAAPERLGTVPGSRLVGSIFEGPFGNDSRVVNGAPYVSMDDGTGIVHTAPGHGAEDFTVGQREGLALTCPVDEGGRFTSEVAGFAGRSVLEVNDDLIAWLRASGRLLHATSLTHSYPHCWRCHRPVIFRATDQWFMIVDHAGHRDRCLEQIEHAVAWDPPSSQNRIREAVRGRPDWCLSRQRAWGVGIPAVYCEACGEPTLDARVLARAAAIVRESDSDAWFERPLEDFLPDGFACPGCGGRGPFRRETDVLDVWFDAGTSHRAVQVQHPELRAAWDAAARGEAEVLYFEGPDQHRGWFNSSLMVAVGVTGRAPYTRVATHGWVLDGQGRAMHKSLGNVVSPLTLIRQHGADVVRWWALSTDWRGDARVGDEILQRVADAYRKVRNTFRFLLGNLHDFDPGRDALAPEALARVDRAALDYLGARLRRVREQLAALEFHRVADGVLDLCTTQLSAVYLDAAKDRLYCSEPADPARRSAQTVLWHALHELALVTSPLLPFTCDEVWEHHPALLREAESVHLATLSEDGVPAGGEQAWEALLELRDAVNAAIEPLKAAKTVATSTEVEVEVAVRPGVTLPDLEPEALRDFLLVAEVRLRSGEPGAAPGRFGEVIARRTSHARCDRCWTYRADVGGDASAPGLCARCRGALAAR